uniref:non-specific protein-tyrosine kinase n=1 Tax=Elaeophora elaphi TaxID=1147741 RepID=A0A0R3S2M2_9BILA
MAAEQYTISELLCEADLLCYEHSMRTVLRLRNAADMSFVDEKDLNKIGMSRPEQKRNSKKKEQHSPSYQEQHVIPLENITLSKQLGKGEFGFVYQASWNNSNNIEQIQVAVKCILPEKLFANPLNFLQEVAVLHKMRHESVVRLYGVVLDTKAVMLVSELAPCGSLLECLQKPSLRATFFVDTFCKFSIQIAQGMKYLSDERLIHRDLAARNVLVFSADRVKISDFGLSRSLGMGEDYYRSEFSEAVKLPIAWCAPEAINFLKFTPASDVWSYGVTLFEIFSFGQMPWAGFSGAQILAAIDYPNLQRLECPDACPVEFYDLMMQCWAHKPEERPSFTDIVRHLPEIIPQCLVTVTSCYDGIIDHLQYSKNETIIVLDKCPPTYPDGYFWRGYMRNGRTGLFRPEETVAKLAIKLPNNKCEQYLSSTSFLAHSKIFSNKKDKVRDKNSRKKLLISEPQGDVHHTCHIGVDGTAFGLLKFGKNDISKSSTAAH